MAGTGRSERRIWDQFEKLTLKLMDQTSGEVNGTHFVQFFLFLCRFSLISVHLPSPSVQFRVPDDPRASDGFRASQPRLRR